MKHTLVLASTNRGKLGELRVLLGEPSLRILTVDDVLKTPPRVVESGRTFAENAVLKARAYAEATMMLTLADDSGLEVVALEGKPGVRSARFAHERATDAENNATLLAALEALGDPASGGVQETFPACFRCVLAVVDPFAKEEPVMAEGVCSGTIIRSPRGAGGFGYDPLFVVDGLDKTMAELTDEEKSRVSHRARAAAALRPLLDKLLRLREEEADRIVRA
jgi:XTP/dITP diphosphohydrolase